MLGGFTFNGALALAVVLSATGTFAIHCASSCEHAARIAIVHRGARLAINYAGYLFPLVAGPAPTIVMLMRLIAIVNFSDLDCFAVISVYEKAIICHFLVLMFAPLLGD